MSSSSFEKKIILLSKLESDRLDKRNVLEKLCEEYHNLGQKMKQIETDLLGLDNDIDELENEVENERPLFEGIINNEIEEKTPNKVLKTQADEYLTDPMMSTTTPMKTDEYLTEFTQTQRRLDDTPDETNNANNYVPRVSTSSFESLQLTTIDITKKKAVPQQQQSNVNINGNINSSSESSKIISINPYLVQQTNKTKNGNSLLPINTLRQQQGSTNNVEQNFPWTQQVNNLLRNTFKINSFRDHQKDIIDSTLSGNDVFVIMRTGGGKSLTYQLPALLEGRGSSKKVTFVISPLLSLIQDQEEQMNEFAPGSATSFSSGLTGGNTEHARRWAMVRDPNQGICLVFVTPEKVSQSNKLCSEMEKLFAQGRLGRFVIDECHCACQVSTKLVQIIENFSIVSQYIYIYIYL